MAVPTFYSAPNGNPATFAAAVTPGTALSKPARSFYIGVAGDLVLTMEDGASVTFVGVQPGIFPVGSALVVSSGTTATSIVALY